MKISDKYKPQSIDDVVFPNSSVEMTVKGYAQGLVIDNLLFWGQPGNGKTTCANLLPKELGASGADVHYFNCSLSTSIDDVHTIEKITGLLPSWDGANRHFIILDEVDGLSLNAQKALKGLIEQRAKYATFYATTNHPSKLEVGFSQRFQKIPMDQIGMSALETHAKHILKKEGYKTGNQKIQAMCHQANGSLRELHKIIDGEIMKAKMSVKQTPVVSQKSKKSA